MRPEATAESARSFQELEKQGCFSAALQGRRLLSAHSVRLDEPLPPGDEQQYEQQD